jgi:hypothetical protein
MMQKWEYQTIITGRDVKWLSGKVTDWNPPIDLEKLGEDGWELISVVPIAGNQGSASGITHQLIIFFKHPKV